MIQFQVKYVFLHDFSCLAGESLHFYDEVQQLEKIPVNDPVKRIYMARHIIEKYINTGIIRSKPSFFLSFFLFVKNII